MILFGLNGLKPFSYHGHKSSPSMRSLGHARRRVFVWFLLTLVPIHISLGAIRTSFMAAITLQNWHCSDYPDLLGVLESTAYPGFASAESWADTLVTLNYLCVCEVCVCMGEGQRRWLSPYSAALLPGDRISRWTWSWAGSQKAPAIIVFP